MTKTLSAHTIHPDELGEAPGPPRRMRAVVVDDNAAVRLLLTSILEEDPRLTVIGSAADGEQAVAVVKRLRPDVVTMDVNMPRASGLEATARIMAEAPTHVVVISANTGAHNVALSMEAVRAGALAVLPGLPSLQADDFAVRARSIRDVVRAAATVRLVVPPSARQGVLDGQARASQPPAALLVAFTAGRFDALQTSIAGLNDAQIPILVTHAPDVAPELLEAIVRVVYRGPVHILQDRAHAAARLHPGAVHIVPVGARAGIREGTPWAWTDGSAASEAAPVICADVAALWGDRLLVVLPGEWSGDVANDVRHLQDRGCRVVAQLPDMRWSPEAGRTDFVAQVADLSLPSRMLGPWLRKQCAGATAAPVQASDHTWQADGARSDAASPMREAS